MNKQLWNHLCVNTVDKLNSMSGSIVLIPKSDFPLFVTASPTLRLSLPRNCAFAVIKQKLVLF